MRHKIRIYLCLFLCCQMLCACHTALAKIAPTSLKELTASSLAIAVARVEDVRLVGDIHIAWATVVRPLKNMQAGQQFTFVAQKTWACSTETAIKGETVLLFLEPSRPLPTTKEEGENLFFPKFEQQKEQAIGNLPFYFITDAGRGRIPPVEYKNNLYLPVARGSSLATGKPCLWFYQIELPAGIQATQLPILPHDRVLKKILRPYVKLSDVEQYITGYVAKKPPTKPDG